MKCSIKVKERNISPKSVYNTAGFENYFINFKKEYRVNVARLKMAPGVEPDA